MHVCKTLSQPNESGLQTCVEWATFTYLDLFQSVAITKSEMIMIGGSLVGIAGVFIAYALFAKAVNQL